MIYDIFYDDFLNGVKKNGRKRCKKNHVSFMKTATVMYTYLKLHELVHINSI